MSGVISVYHRSCANCWTYEGPNNILTVADDLLKNDGQKFLEMMEQLAERRMQREEEAAAEVGLDSEEEDDDEDGEDDDEEEDEDDEDEEEEEEVRAFRSLFLWCLWVDHLLTKVMTEEQKMEEGKRMFSIFAARMFEQRVLQAYREKVAQERQLQLLRELEDEDKAAQEKEAKKQKENQKKKAKKQSVHVVSIRLGELIQWYLADYKNRQRRKKGNSAKPIRLQRRQH